MNNMEKLAKNPIAPYLVKFCESLNKVQELYYKKNDFTFNNPPKVLVHNVGKKYIRLGMFEERPAFSGKLECSSVYCFVDATNGDVLKAGTFKAPAPNGVRGNLMNKDVLKCAGVHGLQYLSGPNYQNAATMLANA